MFCDSEFWHGYDWDNRKNDIKSHQEFWIPKIERTIKRDREVTETLQDSGWIVLRFGEKKFRKYSWMRRYNSKSMGGTK